MNKQKLIAIVSGLSLALLSTAALAATSDSDTQFVSGFDGDAEKAKVIYSVSGLDQESDTTATLDCTLVGDYEYVLGEETDGTARVDELSSVDDEPDEDSDTTFEYEGVIDDPDNESLDPVEYGDEGAEECDLTAVTIEPKGGGELNHGTVVSTMAKQFGPGKGCVMRFIAQSDWGKDSYEVAEGDPIVTLDTLTTSCDKNKRNDDSDSVSSLDDDSTSVGSGQLKANKAKKNGKATAPGQHKNDD